jgi:hypothetical protein
MVAAVLRWRCHTLYMLKMSIFRRGDAAGAFQALGCDTHRSPSP